jgi:hypothetical protein
MPVNKNPKASRRMLNLIVPGQILCVMGNWDRIRFKTLDSLGEYKGWTGMVPGLLAQALWRDVFQVGQRPCAG